MTRIAIILAAALALPVGASAEPAPDSNIAAPASAPTSTGTRALHYCVVNEAMTGSRLETRTCKSLDAWLAEGFDPRVKARR